MVWAIRDTIYAMLVTVLLGLNFSLMILLPIVMGRWIVGNQKVSWGLFGIGAVTFILAQLFHLPFNWLVLQRLDLIDSSNLLLLSIFLGLSAGAFEGVARYLSLRFWAKKARSWRDGLAFGIGHGGIEAIFLGILGIINFAVLLGLKNGYFPEILATVPEDQLYLVDEQINALFGVSPDIALFGAVERIFALFLHLAATLLVMQVFIRQQLRWLFAGILWHGFFDATAVYVGVTWGAVPVETVFGILSLISLAIIFWLRTPEPKAERVAPLPDLSPLVPVEISAESLDRSKYSQ